MHIIVLKHKGLVIFLSRKCCGKNIIGITIMSIGVGMLIAVLMPIWGWLLLGGGALVYVGWCLAEKWRR